MPPPSLFDRNLPQWIQDHITLYQKTNGEEGHLYNGVPALLLTTKGKKSGEPFVLPLFYGVDGGRHVIVASRGGDPRHPRWYTNLVAEPRVEVQVGADKFTALARTATAEEKPALWRMMARIWPAYNGYQAKTKREIPVVILERA